MIDLSKCSARSADLPRSWATHCLPSLCHRSAPHESVWPVGDHRPYGDGDMSLEVRHLRDAIVGCSGRKSSAVYGLLDVADNTIEHFGMSSRLTCHTERSRGLYGHSRSPGDRLKVSRMPACRGSRRFQSVPRFQAALEQS